MTTSRWIAAATVALAAAVGAIVFFPSVRSGPPAFAYGKTSCVQCRMVLSRPGTGAQVRRGLERWEAFDDLGCLQRALRDEPADPADVWVEDHAGGGFVRAADAIFVRAKDVETPMGSGIVAFADGTAAEDFVRAKEASPTSYAELFPAKTPAAPVADASAAFTALEAAAGKDLYRSECAACHGERGDGAGPAAAFLDPKPRDFTKGLFKLRTTESGAPPNPADVLATIENGMPGSAMPSFEHLAPDERRKVGAYVFKLAGLLERPIAEPIADPGEPPAPDSTRLARGKELWGKMGCASCHGEKGRGDGASAPTLTDAWGHKTRPRDLVHGELRGGDDPRDLYYRLYAGIDGSPMPAFGDSVTDEADRWALVSYVSSLRNAAEPAPLPTDPIAAGRLVAARHGCGGCHVLDDGKGGEVGPDLRLVGRKLRPEWVGDFLADPRAPGKIYPWRAHRMPGIELTNEEIAAMRGYLQAIATAAPVEPRTAAPDPATFPAGALAQGKMTFVVKCAQCHALGETVKTPLAAQQGPDLIRAPERLDWDWTKEWILDPRRFDPKTKMVVPGVTESDAEAVRMFIWKTARSERPEGQRASAGTPDDARTR